MSDDRAQAARLLALYLPQFHPIPENDAWWGPGFTEWTNVAKARPLFRGHEQPRLPGELGFYDLRLSEVRAAQAALAKEAGIEAFIYWHYWFGDGRRILEMPFQEVLKSGEPDFPFCLAWANESWSGVSHGETNGTLIEQRYPGDEDVVRHFFSVHPALADPRYVRVDDKPVFFVYRPQELPDAHRFADAWRSLACREGLPGLHLVGMDNGDGWEPDSHGFDAVVRIRLSRIFGLKRLSPIHRGRRFAHRLGPYPSLVARLLSRPVTVHPYAMAVSAFVPANDVPYEWYPCAIPNWDNTPRSGSLGQVLTGSAPDLFSNHLRAAVSAVSQRPDDHRIVVIKSWNEWAEGNYIEPDRRWGRAYLDAVRQVQQETILNATSRNSEMTRNTSPCAG